MKGIYLAAGNDTGYSANILYQDILGNRDISGDMLTIDLSSYDFVLASPPCNYYSRCNYRRETSKYAQSTKHLLPAIIDKLIALDKPFIVENVRNSKLFLQLGLFNKSCFIYEIGRHTYWTNIFLSTSDLPQRQDFLYGGKVIKYNDMVNSYHQGGYNVHIVFNQFLKDIGATND